MSPLADGELETAFDMARALELREVSSAELVERALARACAEGITPSTISAPATAWPRSPVTSVSSGMRMPGR